MVSKSKHLIVILFLTQILAVKITFSQQYGHWEIIDSMNVKRWTFSTSILSNSKILAAGGDELPPYSSAEVYNSQTNFWVNTVDMLEGRLLHDLITLKSGEVIAIGGFKVRSCEIFNPDSNSWRYTDSLKILKEYGNTTTLLSDGRVLVVGGQYFNQSTLQYIYFKTCEIFDPITEVWSFTDSLSDGRSGHTATLLNDGKVLITGGRGIDNHLNSCEIYDPITNLWSSASNMLHKRLRHSAVLLSDGRVLISGGVTPDSTLGTRNCEIYDLAANTWSEAGEITVPRESHKTLLLLDSTILITGGSFEPEVWEIYDPKTLSILYYDTLPVVVFEPELEQFPDGRIISMGGYTFDGINVELSNQCLMYIPKITSIDNEQSEVAAYALEQNYPNPFNPKTIIEYKIPLSSFLELKVYDVLGNEIAVLVNANQPEGIYEVEFNAENLPSGVYFYTLTSGNFRDTKKLILLK